MEQALGVRLFERDRRRVLATSAGLAIVERARIILRDTDDVVELASRSADPLSRTLRIGVIPTISSYFLPRLAPALRRAFPRLTVQWIEDKTEVLVRNLEAGTLDAALVALEADIGDVEREIVGPDAFVLATPMGHPLGSKASPATALELKDASVLLLDDGHCFRKQALAFCSTAKAHELEFRATSLSTLAQMVASGAGVTLLPQLAVATEAERAGLAIRPFARPAPKRTIALVWRRRSPLGPTLRLIAAIAETAYRHALAENAPRRPRGRRTMRPSRSDR
jgi:LysR family hydrogen peroxide-inducible transcriptional activator